MFKLKTYKGYPAKVRIILQILLIAFLVDCTGFSDGTKYLILLPFVLLAFAGSAFSIYPITMNGAKYLFRISGIVGIAIIGYDGFVRISTGSHSPIAVISAAVVFLIFEYYLDEMKRIQEGRKLE